MEHKGTEAYAKLVGAADRLTTLLAESGDHKGVLEGLESLERLGVDLRDEPHLLDRKNRALAELGR